MLKHRLVVVASVVTALACATVPVSAQYVEPGPSGGGSCRPATPEIESSVAVSPFGQGWGRWIAAVRRSVEWRTAPRYAARTFAPAVTRPAVSPLRRRSGR